MLFRSLAGQRCRRLCLAVFSTAAALPAPRGGLSPCTLCFIYTLRPPSLSPSADPAFGTVGGRHRSCFVPVPARPLLDLDPTALSVGWRPGACQTGFITSFDPLPASCGPPASSGLAWLIYPHIRPVPDGPGLPSTLSIPPSTALTTALIAALITALITRRRCRPIGLLRRQRRRYTADPRP